RRQARDPRGTGQSPHPRAPYRRAAGRGAPLRRRASEGLAPPSFLLFRHPGGKPGSRVARARWLPWTPAFAVVTVGGGARRRTSVRRVVLHHGLGLAMCLVAVARGVLGRLAVARAGDELDHLAALRQIVLEDLAAPVHLQLHEILPAAAFRQ